MTQIGAQARMSCRYRLYPTSVQSEGLSGHCADARYVWNLALEQANHWRRGGGSTPNAAQRQRQLAEARGCSWLGDGSSSVQQQALRDFDQALRNWWGGSHRRPSASASTSAAISWPKFERELA